MPSDRVTRLRAAQAAGAACVVDALVADVAAMSEAAAVGRPGLDPFQDHIVSLHLATRHGFLNASTVGAGKTVTTLVALREYARTRAGGRAGTARPVAEG